MVSPNYYIMAEIDRKIAQTVAELVLLVKNKQIQDGVTVGFYETLLKRLPHVVLLDKDVGLI